MPKAEWVEINHGRWALRVGGGAQPLAHADRLGHAFGWHAGHWLGRRKRGEWWPYAFGHSASIEDAKAAAERAVAKRIAEGKELWP